MSKLSDKFIPSKDVVVREVGGETVLLDLTGGTYFGLNSVGTRVWQLLSEEGQGVASLCDCIVAEFDVSREDAETDITALISALVERQLLTSAAL